MVCAPLRVALVCASLPVLPYHAVMHACAATGCLCCHWLPVLPAPSVSLGLQRLGGTHTTLIQHCFCFSVVLAFVCCFLALLVVPARLAILDHCLVLCASTLVDLLGRSRVLALAAGLVLPVGCPAGWRSVGGWLKQLNTST
jgi:hypothetical protein